MIENQLQCPDPHLVETFGEIDMGWSLLVQNVDGSRVDDTWGAKPTAEQLRYTVGGMWEEAHEQEIIDSLLDNGYAEVNDSACTTYTLSES